MKRCIKCKKEKDESEFLDRFHYKCIDCLREIVEENERIEKTYRIRQYKTNRKGKK